MSETYSPSGNVGVATIKRATAAEAATGTHGQQFMRDNVTALTDRARYHRDDGQYRPPFLATLNTKAEGLICDSAADDFAAFNTLVNTTMQPGGGTLDVVGVPRIGTNLTIPVNVTLNFLGGAYLAPDGGVTVTINGAFNRHLEKKFGGGGAVSLASSKVPYASPIWFGAKGDWNGTTGTDDTIPIRSALTSGAKVFDFGRLDYKISLVEGTSVGTFTGLSRIRVRGSGKIYDATVYTNTGVVTAIFTFDASTDCSVKFNYEGVPLPNPDDAANGVGYQGATFVNIQNGCQHIELEGELKHLRYGMLSGGYTTPAAGYNKHLYTKVKTFKCGYPIAHYLAEDVHADIYAEEPHRSAYLAGAKGFDVRVRFLNQHIAPSQVLLTDATTNNGISPGGTSRGCSGGKVNVRDMGSTIFVPNSYCCAISLSRVDPGTIYEDIDIHVNVVGSDGVASTIGGFALYSDARTSQPSYPFNWEPTILLRKIKVSGIVDRSAQTIATHGTGELYINTLDTGSHFAAVSMLDLTDYHVIQGSGSNPRACYCVVPGLTDRVNVRGCNFGNYTLEFIGNTVAPINFIDCAPITRTSANGSDTSLLHFRNTPVTTLGSPSLNATHDNSTNMGAGELRRTIVKDIALSGASVSFVGIIPPGALVVGVSGRLTSAITGASGFQVGVAGDLIRYADQSLTALGSTFTRQQSEATEVGARIYRSFTDVVVTAKTANFTGGVMRIAVTYDLPVAPT